MLILKAIPAATRTTSNGFIWAEVGQTVEAPDWDRRLICGGGLHGWANGIGNVGTCLFNLDSCTWLVVSADDADVVDLEGKVKFRAGTVVFEGSMREAAAYIIDRTGEQGPVIGAHLTLADGEQGAVGAYGLIEAGYNCTVTAADGCTVTAADGCTVTAGYCCTVTAGDYSKVTAGNECTVTAADGCTVTAGNECTVTCGNYSKVTTGYGCTVTAGYRCKVTAADGCKVTAGYGCTVTAADGCTVTAADNCTVTAADNCTVTCGNYSKVTAADDCTVTAVNECTVTAGNDCVLMLQYWDHRVRVSVAYTGEDDIEPGQPYKLDENHKFTKVEKE